MDEEADLVNEAGAEQRAIERAAAVHADDASAVSLLQSEEHRRKVDSVGAGADLGETRSPWRRGLGMDRDHV